MTTLSSAEPDAVEPLPLSAECLRPRPRNAQEREVFNLVSEALTGGPGKVYASTADLIAELRTELTAKRA